MRRYQLIPSHAVQTLLITSVSPLPSGEIGAPYSFTFNAIGGVAPYSWSEVGAIPSGLTFSGGTLSGTPTGTFSSSFNVTVTDSVGSQFTRAFSLTVITAVQITTASPLPGGTVGVAYSTTIAATGGATPYSWSILGFTGANSYSINSVTGVLTGTLGVAEIDSINIQVVDALGIPSAKNFNLTVIPAASLTITTTSPLPAATQSSAYSTTMAATGGTPPYTWSLTSHTGTNTWSVSSSGVVTGTPANLETDSLVIKVTDSVANTASGTFSLTVNPASGIVFDFFISPTGDDNNNGLTPATAWSITALNSKQATYGGTGKKIGVIGDISGTQTPIQHGTIGGTQTTLYAIVQAAGAGPPILNLDGGSSGSPTVLASCTSSGVYQQGWAIIDYSNPSGGAHPTADGVQGIGQSGQSSTQVPHPGNVTVDGIVSRNFCYAGMCFESTGGTGSAMLNIIVQNCEFYGSNTASTSSNPGCLRLEANGAQVLNCKFHDCTSASGFTGYAMPGIMCYGTEGLIVTNCTFYNIGPSVQQKDGSQDATISYCYMDSGAFGVSSGYISSYYEGCNAAGRTTTVHHNIILGDFWLQGASGQAYAGNWEFYNNTCYNASSSSPLFYVQTPTAGSTFHCYNNVLWPQSGSYNGTYGVGRMLGASATLIPQWDYNYYHSAPQFNTGSLISYASWQSLGGFDGHSVASGTTPFASTPSNSGGVPNISSFGVTGTAATMSTTGGPVGCLDGTGSIGCNF